MQRTMLSSTLVVVLLATTPTPAGGGSAPDDVAAEALRVEADAFAKKGDSKQAMSTMTRAMEAATEVNAKVRLASGMLYVAHARNAATPIAQLESRTCDGPTHDNSSS
jgi:hypothetical protein